MTRMIIAFVVTAPIVLELAVSLWRRQVAPEPVRKLFRLIGVQVGLPIVFAVAVAAVRIAMWLDKADPDALCSFGVGFVLIGGGVYAVSWLFTTIIGLLLIQETQQHFGGDGSTRATN